jgi:hypothetical protein
MPFLVVIATFDQVHLLLNPITSSHIPRNKDVVFTMMIIAEAHPALKISFGGVLILTFSCKVKVRKSLTGGEVSTE